MTGSTSIRSRSRRRFLTSAIALVPMAVVRAPARAAQFSWKFGFGLAPDHSVNVRMVEAFGRIRAETGGQLDIQSFPNGSLGNTDNMIRQLRLGAIELMAGNGGNLDSIVPVAAIESIPFAFPNSRTLFRAMDGELGKMIRDAFPSKGLYLTDAILENGFRYFTTGTRAIHNVNDLQGLKLRVPVSRLYLDTFRSLGAAVATVVTQDLYVALQTHLVDAQETPLSFIEAERIFEVQRYCSATRHMWAGYWIVFNIEKWQSLPAKFQEVARKHINAAAMLQRRDNARLEESLRDKLHRQGLTFNDDIDLGSFKSKLASTDYYARWRNEYGAAAWTAMEKYGGHLG